MVSHWSEDLKWLGSAPVRWLLLCWVVPTGQLVSWIMFGIFSWQACNPGSFFMLWYMQDCKHQGASVLYSPWVPVSLWYVCRFTQKNLHQRPTVALLCGPHVQGAQGISCGRHLANHEVEVILFLPNFVKMLDSVTGELTLFSKTGGKQVSSVKGENLLLTNYILVPRSLCTMRFFNVPLHLHRSSRHPRWPNH